MTKKCTLLLVCLLALLLQEKSLGQTTNALSTLPNNQSIGFATNASGFIRTGQTATNTLLLQARDVDGAAWTTFGTLTAGDTPTFDLAAGTTLGTAPIATTTGTQTLSAKTLATPTITGVTTYPVGSWNASGVTAMRCINGSGGDFSELFIGGDATAINNSIVSLGGTGAQGVSVRSSSAYAWTSTSAHSQFATRDTFLNRHAAGHVLVGFTTGSSFDFSVANVYVNSTNYELGSLLWNSNVLEVGTYALGTGTARPLRLVTAGTERVEISSAGVVDSGSVFQVGKVVTSYGAGTAYALTNVSAAVDLGTTDPVVVLDQAGVYRLSGRVNLKYTGATFAANQNVTLKLRRTNNTAADITNSSTVIVTGVVTTVTETFVVVQLPEVSYTTALTNDSITIFADVATAPSAGSLDVTEASIWAERVQ